MMNLNYRSFYFALACAIFSFPAFGQTAPAALSNDTVVTQKHIKTKGGYPFNVEGMGSFALVSLKTAKKTDKQCKIKLEDLKAAVSSQKDMPAMQQALNAATGIVKVELKMHHDPENGDVWCAGGGKGCVAIVEVKSMKSM